jgi:hypothetical protein
MLTALPLSAHEFWVEPNHEFGQENSLQLTYLNGHGFAGDVQMPHGDTTRKISVETSSAIQNIGKQQQFYSEESLTLKELPADSRAIGLELTESVHRYNTLADFAQFAREEGHPWAATKHKQRDLPEVGFSELVRRYTKTLLCMDDGNGDSPVMGLGVEWLVSDTSIVSYGKNKTWGAKLLVDGKVTRNHPLHVFYRAENGAVRVSKHTTDRSGWVDIPDYGSGEYLLNTVVLGTPSIRESLKFGTVWESRWGSVLFDTSRECDMESGEIRS